MSFRHTTISACPVQAFSPPVLSDEQRLFCGGPVLPGDGDTDQLRHTRFWEPADCFDPAADFPSHLPGLHAYMGPVYDHFGHYMAEMVHRILPARRLFQPTSWLIATNLSGVRADHAAFLPKAARAILTFLDVPLDRIRAVHTNTIVEALQICEQGSDLGGGPKPGYLDEVRAFTERRLAREEDGGRSRGGKLYVSRSRMRTGVLLGETYLEALLADEGYRVFHPERHGFAAQVAAYAGADVAVFAEGSAVHGTEMLGTGMLKTAAMILRRPEIGRMLASVLACRAETCVELSPSILVGTAYADRGEPDESLGASLLNGPDLVADLRRSGLARLSAYDPKRLRAAAEQDFLRYLGSAIGDRMFDRSRLRGLIAAFERALAQSTGVR